MSAEIIIPQLFVKTIKDLVNNRPEFKKSIITLINDYQGIIDGWLQSSLERNKNNLERKEFVEEDNAIDQNKYKIRMQTIEMFEKAIGLTPEDFNTE